MTKILITGFEAFGGMPVNPSQVLVDSISKISFESNFQIEIIAKILPVNFKESGNQMLDLIRENTPDILIATGVDLSKTHIELERVAHKNSEYLYPNFLAKISPSIQLDKLPDNYFSNLDLDSILEKILKEGINAIVSEDTGMYVCNHVYYLANIISNYLDSNLKSCFIHIPYPYPYWIGETHIVPDYSMKEIQEGFLKILAAIIESNIATETIT